MLLHRSALVFFLALVCMSQGIRLLRLSQFPKPKNALFARPPKPATQIESVIATESDSNIDAKTTVDENGDESSTTSTELPLTSSTTTTSTSATPSAPSISKALKRLPLWSQFIRRKNVPQINKTPQNTSSPPAPQNKNKKFKPKEQVELITAPRPGHEFVMIKAPRVAATQGDVINIPIEKVRSKLSDAPKIIETPPNPIFLKRPPFFPKRSFEHKKKPIPKLVKDEDKKPVAEEIIKTITEKQEVVTTQEPATSRTSLRFSSTPFSFRHFPRPNPSRIDRQQQISQTPATQVVKETTRMRHLTTPATTEKPKLRPNPPPFNLLSSKNNNKEEKYPDFDYDKILDTSETKTRSKIEIKEVNGTLYEYEYIYYYDDEYPLYDYDIPAITDFQSPTKTTTPTPTLTRSRHRLQPKQSIQPQRNTNLLLNVPVITARDQENTRALFRTNNIVSNINVEENKLPSNTRFPPRVTTPVPSVPPQPIRLNNPPISNQLNFANPRNELQRVTTEQDQRETFTTEEIPLTTEASRSLINLYALSRGLGADISETTTVQGIDFETTQPALDYNDDLILDYDSILAELDSSTAGPVSTTLKPATEQTTILPTTTTPVEKPRSRTRGRARFNIQRDILLRNRNVTTTAKPKPNTESPIIITETPVKVQTTKAPSSVVNRLESAIAKRPRFSIRNRLRGRGRKTTTTTTAVPEIANEQAINNTQVQAVDFPSNATDNKQVTTAAPDVSSTTAAPNTRGRGIFNRGGSRSRLRNNLLNRLNFRRRTTTTSKPITEAQVITESNNTPAAVTVSTSTISTVASSPVRPFNTRNRHRFRLPSGRGRPRRPVTVNSVIAEQVTPALEAGQEVAHKIAPEVQPAPVVSTAAKERNSPLAFPRRRRPGGNIFRGHSRLGSRFSLTTATTPSPSSAVPDEQAIEESPISIPFDSTHEEPSVVQLQEQGEVLSSSTTTSTTTTPKPQRRKPFFRNRKNIPGLAARREKLALLLGRKHAATEATEEPKPKVEEALAQPVLVANEEETKPEPDTPLVDQETGESAIKVQRPSLSKVRKDIPPSAKPTTEELLDKRRLLARRRSQFLLGQG